MEYYNRDKEIREAIEAGERALVSLRRADEKLSSARTWGIIDLIGGGDKFFALDERTGDVRSFELSADDFIETCCKAFSMYTDYWAKFDTLDAPSDTPYLSDYTVHASFITDSVEEIRQYYLRKE